MGVARDSPLGSRKAVEGSVWWYAPDRAAPIAFIILFFLSGVVHFYQNFRYKAWKATPLLPWAAILMTTGFIMREVGAYHYNDLGILIASIVLIMSGPPVYAAINYIVFCRCLYYVPFMSPIHPLRVLATFLGIDAVIEILIGNGAARMANTSESRAFRKVGEDLVKSALILQAVFFVIFIVIGVRFQYACNKKGILQPNLKKVLLVMYASCLLITARCIYRIVEFFEGFEGTIYTTEWYFWVFEATLMFMNTLLLNVFHPGRYLPSSPRNFLARDGVVREGPGWEDNRHILLKFFDVLDLWGLITGRDKHTRFWDWEPAELEDYVANQKQAKADRKCRRRAMWSRQKSVDETKVTTGGANGDAGEIGHAKQNDSHEAQEVV